MKIKKPGSSIYNPKRTNTKNSTHQKNYAKESYSILVENFNKLETIASMIVLHMYLLLLNDTYKSLNFNTVNEFIKDLKKNINRHRSSVNDYKICALMFIELKLEPIEKISNSSLLELNKCEKKYRNEIWSLAVKLSEESNKQYPTAELVIQAKEQYQDKKEVLNKQSADTKNSNRLNNSTDLQQKDKVSNKAEKASKSEQIQSASSSISSTQPKADEVEDSQMKAKMVLGKVKQYDSKKLEIFHKRIFPKGPVSMFANRLLREMTNTEYDKFLKDFEEYYNAKTEV